MVDIHLNDQAFWVVLAISPQMGILVILASHFRTRAYPPPATP